MSEALKIGIIGDFNPEYTSHLATNEALGHCANYLNNKIEITWLPTKGLDLPNEIENLSSFDGLFCAPGSPYESLTGALNGIRFARENNVPFIGTCGGFQHVIIEYARNVLNFKDAQHAEYDPYASNLFISALACSLAGKTLTVYLDKNSNVYDILKKEKMEEKYYCNFGINPAYQKLLIEGGLNAVGYDEEKEVRIITLPQNDFFYATLFVPQTNSTPENPHKLLLAYLEQAEKLHLNKRKK